MTHDRWTSGDAELTSALRALYAAPSDEAYWESLESRILAHVAQADEGKVWWAELAEMVRPGLAAAAALIFCRQPRLGTFPPAGRQQRLRVRHHAGSVLHGSVESRNIGWRWRRRTPHNHFPLGGACIVPNNKRSCSCLFKTRPVLLPRGGNDRN